MKKGDIVEVSEYGGMWPTFAWDEDGQTGYKLEDVPHTSIMTHGPGRSNTMMHALGEAVEIDDMPDDWEGDVIRLTDDNIFETKEDVQKETNEIMEARAARPSRAPKSPKAEALSLLESDYEFSKQQYERQGLDLSELDKSHAADRSTLEAIGDDDEFWASNRRNRNARNLAYLARERAWMS